LKIEMTYCLLYWQTSRFSRNCKGHWYVWISVKCCTDIHWPTLFSDSVVLRLQTNI